MTKASAVKIAKQHLVKCMKVRAKDLVLRHVHRADSVTTGKAWIVSLTTVDCMVSAICCVTVDGEVVDLA